MASATALPSIGIQNLSIKDNFDTPTYNGDTMLMPADYWTTLLRKNLAIAKVLVTADSDTEDASTPQLDEEIMNSPRRRSARDALAREIAARLYPAPPDSLAPIIKYEIDIVMLRSM